MPDPGVRPSGRGVPAAAAPGPVTDTTDAGGPEPGSTPYKGADIGHRTAARTPLVRTIARWSVVVVITGHGMLHLLGAAKGLGGAGMTSPRQPIAPVAGAAWLLAAALVVITGLLLALRNRWWWAVGAFAVVTSQLMILSSWADASVGTAANVIMLGAVIYGYSSSGPTSFRAQYHRRASTALDATASPTKQGVIGEPDLARLPRLVAAYIRRSGAVGQRRITSFRARMHGRIRGGADMPWMSFTGQQVNTYGTNPARLFLLDATMFGMPVDVLHSYVDGSATMRVKMASLIPLVTGAGSEMDRAETVTLFNDMCVFAPAALVDARVTWEPVDEHQIRGSFANGANVVSAVLVFNDGAELVDFVSDDRSRASADGKTFTAQRWSTPISNYRTVDSRHVGGHGEARWHAPAPEGEFCYLELDLDNLWYNVRS